MAKTNKTNIIKQDKKPGIRHHFVNSKGEVVIPTPEQEQAWKDKAWEDLWALLSNKK